MRWVEIDYNSFLFLMPNFCIFQLNAFVQSIFYLNNCYLISYTIRNLYIYIMDIQITQVNQEIPTEAIPEAIPKDNAILPTNPAKNTLPIPSKEILPPQTNYKDYMKKKQFQVTEGGSLILNQHNLKLLCMKDGLYEYPQLNTKLYLHFKVIQKIQNLHEYINVKTLYLENNVIRTIQNLDCLPQLENLFLQNNMINVIENLQKCSEIKVINFSSNNITKIQGLSQLRKLQNLNISSNQLSDFESVEHLGQCSEQLTAIDLSSNRIKYYENFYDLIPQVKLLYLSGNPFAREAQHYRRQTIGRLKNLLYLDQRGVSEQQRIYGQKWVQEGQQGFNKAKKELVELKKKRKTQEKQQIMKNIDTHRQKKINLFTREIEEQEKQIARYQSYLRQPENQSQFGYYEATINEKKMKILELEGFIKSITGRFKKPQAEPVEIKKSESSLPQTSISIDIVEEENINRENINYDDLQTEQSVPYMQSQADGEFEKVDILPASSLTFSTLSMQESVPYESQIEESKQEERNMFKKKYDLDELD